TRAAVVTAPGDRLGEPQVVVEQRLASGHVALEAKGAPEPGGPLGGRVRAGAQRHRKPPTTPCSTRLQPSISTNIKILIGKDSVVGGTMIMPKDSSTEETTRSISRNGRKMTKPILKETRSSLSMKAEVSFMVSTSAARAGSGWRAMS